MRSTCRRCKGQGSVLTNPCRKCNGAGTVQEKKTITIPVPAGITVLTLFICKSYPADVVLFSLLLTLNSFHTLFCFFHCWVWTSKCQVGLFSQWFCQLVRILVPTLRNSLFHQGANYCLFNIVTRVRDYKLTQNNFWCFSLYKMMLHMQAVGECFIQVKLFGFSDVPLVQVLKELIPQCIKLTITILFLIFRNFTKV